MAPEVTLGKEYNEKCDVYSFGIIIYEVFYETCNPYSNESNFNVEQRVAQGLLNIIIVFLSF